MPKAVLVPTEVGSPEWLEARRQGVTATDLPILLRLAPWSSVFDLYWQKKGVVEPALDSDQLWWGRAIEPVILRRFSEEHPELWVRPGALFRHGDDPRWMATPDGLAYDHDDPTNPPPADADPVATVQAKTARSSEHWGDPGTDEIPAYYLAQVRWEMFVIGVNVAYVPVLFAGSRYAEYVVEQDADDVRLMVDAAEDFMTRLENDEQPDVDDRPDTTRALKQLHPDIEDTEVELEPAWVEAYRIARDQEQQAKDAKRHAENKIRKALGAAARGTIAGRPVVSRSVYDRKAYVVKGGRVDRLYVRTAREDTK